MEHILLKAATTATTDSGEFTAIAAAYSVDRVKDRIVPGAFKNTIARWQESGKMIPLHWNHEGAASSIIGSIDPATMREEPGKGLYVEGKLDLADSEIAREAWRSIKNGTMSLSFGYAVDKARKAAGGITELLELDLFEISIVPAPANADTKVLSWKSAADAANGGELVAAMVEHAEEYLRRFGAQGPLSRQVQDVLDHLTLSTGLAGIRKATDDLRRQAGDVEREVEESRLPNVKAPPVGGAVRILQSMVGQAQEFISAEPDAEDAEIMAEILSALEDLLDDEETEPNEDDPAKSHLFVRRVTLDEIEGVKAGEIKAVWSTAYVNNLPDSAFLYVEPGGTKDDEGKTVPRSNRHFPYKDAEGAVDLPHLRNAASRIPQAQFLSQAQKDRLTSEVQGILENQKSAEPDKGHTRARSADPQRARAEELALEVASGGLSTRPSPKKAAEKPPELMPLEELKQRSRDLMLTTLLNGTEL